MVDTFHRSVRLEIPAGNVVWSTVQPVLNLADNAEKHLAYEVEMPNFGDWQMAVRNIRNF